MARLTTPHVSISEVRRQLDKILASSHFVRAARLSRLLRFIVEQTLAGRENELKEYSLGLEVFDKSAAYDPRLDPIVRVTAHELRAKLAAYYRTDGRDDPIVIQCASGAYVPSFCVRGGEAHGEADDVRTLYLKGLFHLDRQSRRALVRSTYFFRQALRKEPTNAAVEAALANSYWVQCFTGFVAPRNAMPKARAAALRALAIDDRFADAHSSLATVTAAYEWDWPAAEKGFRRALELDPASAATYRRYATTYLAPLGLLDDAIYALERAVALGPLSIMTNVFLAQMLYMARRFDGAVRQARRTLDLDPQCGPAHLMLGLAHMQKSRHEEAAQALRIVETVAADSTFLRGALGHCLASGGRVKEARRVLADLVALSRRRYVPPFDIARIYIGLNDHDRAFAWLGKGVAQRCSRLIWINVYPMLDALRADPRFPPLIKRLGLAA